MQMNRVVADTHAAAFSRMTSNTKKTHSSTLSNHAAVSDSVRAITGSAERLRGRDGYAAFYSRPK
jgi:hypothetical protein